MGSRLIGTYSEELNLKKIEESVQIDHSEPKHKRAN